MNWGKSVICIHYATQSWFALSKITLQPLLVWCWERLKAGGEGDDRGWDGWMASPTQWTWVFTSSESWWWTGKPGVPQSMGHKSWTWLSDWTELKCMLSHFSHVRLFVTPWTVAHQAPLSMGFSRQEYWSGLPCPPPGDLPNPGIEPTSLTCPALAGRFFTTSATWEAPNLIQTSHHI